MDLFRAKSVASAAAAAALAAAALLATAAAAHAVPSPDYGSNGVITVRYYDTPSGLTASIWDNNNPDGTNELCDFISSGTNEKMVVPFRGSTVLNGHGPGSIYIGNQPSLGGPLHVRVFCEGTGESFEFSTTY